MCVSSAPGGFRLDAARQSHPAEPEADANEEVLAAAEGCPVEAIAIRLLESGEQVFPPEEYGIAPPPGRGSEGFMVVRARLEWGHLRCG